MSDVKLPEGAIQQEFDLSALPSSWAESLKSRGFVNKEGKVCVGFLRPMEDAESSGLKDAVKKALSADNVLDTRFRMVNIEALKMQKFNKQENEPELKNLNYFYKIGQNRRPRIPSPKAAVTRLRSVFRDNELNRPERFTKSGLLDFKRVTRLAMTERVFQRKHKLQKGHNYVVHVAIDCSSSMHSNDPESLLSSVGANLVEDLAGLARVALYTHTTDAKCVKQINDSSKKKMCDVYHQVLVGLWACGGGNSFSNCFKLIKKKIDEYPDKSAKHLVFFCADGGNCGGLEEDEMCKKAVKELKRVAYITCIGIVRNDINIINAEIFKNNMSQCNQKSTGYPMRFFYSIGDIYTFVANELKRRLVRKMV